MVRWKKQTLETTVSDLLRVVALLGVILLHVLGHGKVLATAGAGVGFGAMWAVEILAYPAVNCFILVSGYVGYRPGNPFPKAKNLLSLWFTVLFYSVALTLLFRGLYPDGVSAQRLLNACFPVLKDQYWFFTCYFGMFLLSPALNALADAVPKHAALGWALGLGAAFSCSTLVGDPFVLDGGYTVLWFLLLYLLGALMKKACVTNTLPAWGAALITVLSLLVTWLSKLAELAADTLPLAEAVAQRNDRIIAYSSPTVLCAAIGALCLFSRISVGKVGQRLLGFFSPAAFSVYLIHDNKLFRQFVMKGRFAFVNELSPAVGVITVIGCAVGIFLIAALVDKVREGLFRLCRIDKFAGWLTQLPSRLRQRKATEK